MEYIIFENADRTIGPNKRGEASASPPILEKLTELKLYASKFDAIKQLMLRIKDYVSNGEPQQINIEFPEFNRRIKGTLETNRWSESVIKMTEMN